MSKDVGFSVLVFNAVCGFFIFSIWFSVFVKNTSGFSVLVSNVVFGFSYFFFLFGPIWVYSFVCGFRFWPILFAVLRFWMNFSSVLRFLLYTNAPLYEPSGPSGRSLISGFCSRKRVGVFLITLGWDASPSQDPST